MAVEREPILIGKSKKYKNSRALKKEMGITLVALIVTIIILMILAGVVIATVTGNNGILSKSKFAKDKYQNSVDKENSALSNYENEIDKTALDIASSRDKNSLSSGDLLWTGHYSTSIQTSAKQTTSGVSLNKGCNIENYTYLLIICCYAIDYDHYNYYTTIFPVEFIKSNYGYPSIETGIFATTSFYSEFNLGFVNNSTFYIAWKNTAGWLNQAVNSIYGIK